MRLLIYCVVFWVLGTLSLQAQGLARLQKANQLYANKQYAEALEEYEALQNSSRSAAVLGVDAKINFADCYRATGQPIKAERLYSSLMEHAKSRPEMHLQYGEVLMLLARYQDAEREFQRYAELRPEDPRAANLLKRSKDIQAIRALYPSVVIALDSTVSDSMTDEFGLAFYGANTLVFASDRIPEGDVLAEWSQRSYLNIHISEIGEGGSLSSPKLFAQKLNQPKRHNGPATFSRDGKTVYFSQSAQAVELNTQVKDIALHIMESRLENDQWTKPEALPFNQDNRILSQPTLSADGKTMVFMSNMPGGFGGTDLWMTTYKGDRWTNPRNLGDQINTSDNEGFPFLHPDGSLYFASKGHAGYGGYDLFRAKPAGNGIDWLAPENIGQPLNSGSDDTYFLLSDDQTWGFLSSARLGSDDIFYFKIEDAEPQELPEGVLPRGSTDFIDGPDLSAAQSRRNEEVVDSILRAAQANPQGGGGTELTTPGAEPGTTTGGGSTNGGTTGGGALTGANQPSPGSETDPSPTENPDTQPGGELVDVTDPKTNPQPGGGKRPDSETGNSNTGTGQGSSSSNQGTGGTEASREANPQLSVALGVVDADQNSPLADVQVSVMNRTTGKTETLRSDQAGGLLLKLQPDQDYEIRAEHPGYFYGSLPISTYGAYKSQSVTAKLPLYRKEAN